MNEFNVSLKICAAAAHAGTYIFLQCGHFAKVLNLSSIHCKKKRGGGEKVEKNASVNILLHVKCHGITAKYFDSHFLPSLGWPFGHHHTLWLGISTENNFP